MLRKSVPATLAAILALGLMAPAAQAATPRAATASLAATSGLTAPRLTKLVAEAKHQATLGISYLYGGGHGATPAPLNSHVDCSGFVRELYYYAFGADIGAGTGDSAIRLSGKFTKTSHPVPGDVALFGNNGSAPAFHTGIYIGNVNGHPAMVASPAPGQNIKVQLGLDQYWAPLIMGYWHFNGATAADSGPAVSLTMAGAIDLAAGRVGGLSVRGWAVDPQNRGVSPTVAITVDRHLRALQTTTTVRPDVNRVLHATGAHGFSAVIAAPPGRHTVCVTARPVVASTSAKSLGCKIVVTPAVARGAFDRATNSIRSFLVAGWAYDPHSPALSIVVRVTVDGRAIAVIWANRPRPDVNSSLHITGAHGFSAHLGATAGRHTVCAIALPASAASVQGGLGCKVVTASS